MVWIEPEWNWNELQLFRVGWRNFRLNRTRVELKQCGVNQNTFETFHVWIEPEWNWNELTMLSSGIMSMQVWIEPEWNWNTRTIERLKFLGVVWIEPEWNWNTMKRSYVIAVDSFESNQSGIETISVIFSVWLLKARLNRTRVELKQERFRRWSVPVPSVWIEPEWNWNDNEDNRYNILHKFESNQSGIETSW